MTRRARRSAVALVAVGMLVASCSGGASTGSAGGGAASGDATAGTRAPPTTVAKAPDEGRVANPTVAPLTGGTGRASGGMRYDTTAFGYQEQEYAFSGTAKTYPPSPLPPAPFTSRMIVWTPTDPSRFNGVTVVEWAHVSDYGQFELTVDLNYHTPMLEAEGYAFALVSAEEGGVCDRTDAGCTGTSLRGVDPERYGSLDHPGDGYSFDIFNQALQAIKHPGDVNPMGTLDTRTIIVEGFQPTIDKWFPVGAAPQEPTPTAPLGAYGPLNTYLANGADDDARLADAFLIDAAAPPTEPASYRVPTLHHLDESAIRRTATPDTTNHVTWEVVGATHADRWAGDHIRLPSSTPKPKLTRDEELARRDAADDYGQGLEPLGDACSPGPKTTNLFPRRYTMNAALVALRQWAEAGVPAPAAPRIERVGPPPTTPTEKLVRDADGNAVGGLRAPVVAVPVAAYDGEGCVAAGTGAPLPAERLAALYPTHGDYVRRITSATDDAVAGRFLVCQDAETLLRKASASGVGGTDPSTATPACAAG